MFTEAKRAYLRQLGYDDARIKELERQSKATKERPNALAELVYKQLDTGATPKPNAISELLAQRLQGKEAPPTHAERLGAAIAERPPFISDLIARVRL